MWENSLKIIGILVLSWICLNVFFQLWYQLPSKTSKKVRFLLYRQHQIDKTLVTSSHVVTPNTDDDDDNIVFTWFTWFMNYIMYPFEILFTAIQNAIHTAFNYFTNNM